MSYECVLSNWKGNYINDPEVHVFSFSKDRLFNV